MTTLSQAAALAAVDAVRYRDTKFVLVRTRDDYGKWTVEHCPEEDGAHILYGPLLKHGLATIVGRLGWDAGSGQVTSQFVTDDAAWPMDELDAGQRQAMACLHDEA